MTTISRIDVFTATLPFRFSFGHALAARRSSTNVYVRVTLEDGTVGFGEGVPRDYVTGETVEGAVAAIAERYAPAVLGNGVCRSVDVPAFLDDAAEMAAPGAQPQPAAWCALELAVLDAFGHHFDCSVSDWLGAAPAKTVRYDFIIPFASAPAMHLLGLAIRGLGFNQVKVKVGRDLDTAERGLAALRRTAGAGIDLRVDANCAWTADEAITALARLRQFHLSGVEQPLPANDTAGLQRVTAAVPESVIVDESLCSVEDALRLADRRACNAFNIRVSKCGGLRSSARIAAIAEQAGLACIVGSQVGESGILSAAGRHLAANLPSVRHLEGSAGRLLLKEDLTMENVLPGWGGWARPFSGAGLGVQVRPEVLGRYGHVRRVLDAATARRRAFA